MRKSAILQPWLYPVIKSTDTSLMADVSTGIEQFISQKTTITTCYLGNTTTYERGNNSVLMKLQLTIRINSNFFQRKKNYNYCRRDKSNNVRVAKQQNHNCDL